MNRRQRAKVRQLVEPALDGLGLDLVAVEVTTDGRGTVLRLSVDHPDGVGIRECVRATRAVERIFEDADPLPAAWRFEVSSPGIDRPVERLADFERFAGYRCRVRLAEGAPKRRFTAVLAGIAPDGQVQVRDGDDVWSFDIDDVERANLVLDLDEFEALGGGAPKGEPE